MLSKEEFSIKRTHFLIHFFSMKFNNRKEEGRFLSKIIQNNQFKCLAKYVCICILPLMHFALHKLLLMICTVIKAKSTTYSQFAFEFCDSNPITPLKI